MSPLGGAVADAAAAGDAVSLARALVATPSVNPTLEAGGSGERRIAERAAGWLDAWGFRVELQEVAPGRFNVVGSLGSGPRTLLLNGHLDTVGVEGMTVPPFGAQLRDGRLLGRGACDMKGGVAALLSAARAMADDPPPEGRLLVALTADEEHASLGMAALVEGGLGADAAVVCEPTDLAVMPAHKGFVWLETTFSGRAAHGSRPERGIDAIRHAGLLLSRLDELEARIRATPPHVLLGHGSIHAGTIEGGSAPSVYPERCTLVLERRTLPAETPDAVRGEVAELLTALREDVPALEAEVSVGLSRPGTEVPEHGELVQGLLRGAEAQGLERRVEGMTAWVDAAFLNEAGIPAVCFGPGSIAQAHAADEWIQAEQIETCARVLESFGRTFLGEPGAGGSVSGG